MEESVIAELFKCPWQTLSFENCEHANTYLHKFFSQDNLYAILVWDQVTLFYEILHEMQIKERLKDCNKRLESPVNKVLKHIQETLSNRNGLMVEVTSQKLTISIRNKFVGDIPFNWVFNCEGSAEFTETILNKPIIYSISSLLCENAKLKAIISKKDAEIEDYKDNGAKVSRQYLETIKFDEKSFNNNLQQSKDFAIALTTPIPEILISDSFNNKIISTTTHTNSEELKAAAEACPTKVNKFLNNSKKSPKKLRHKRNLKPKVRGCVLEEAIEGSDKSLSNSNPRKTEKTPFEISPDKKKIRKSKRAVF